MKLNKKYKVVLWGHNIHNGSTHTHSWIHYAFVKAFKYLGIDTYWHDDTTDQTSFDYSNCFFITEGQVCDNIPLREDCLYVLHNCYDN